MKVGGVIFVFSGMIFWFWVSRSWGNATPCLYSLTFSGSIQAQNLCKSLAGVRRFKVCGACMRKFCTKEKNPPSRLRKQDGDSFLFLLEPLVCKESYNNNGKSQDDVTELMTIL